jgi:hypothetical protein
MELADNFRHLGLLAAAILLVGLLGVLHFWPNGKNRTFSQHVAISKAGIAYYILLFTIILPLLLLFFLKWFVPRFEISSWFTVLIVLSAVTQYLCTLIPEVGGTKTKVHRLLAFISATCLPAALIIASSTGNFTDVGRTILLGAVGTMIVIVAVLIKSRVEHGRLLYHQAAYFFVFFVGILGVTYLT